MSVLILVTITADPAEFDRVHQERPDDFRRASATGKAAGCIHHRFAAADGKILILDEWPDASSFQNFFGDPLIASLMQDAKVTAPPDVAIFESLDTVDQF